MNLRSFRRAIFVALAFIPILAVAAPPSQDNKIPEPLKAWESWALWGEDHRDCPTPYSDARKHLCFWPSKLALQADAAAGRFTLGVTVFNETWIPLPGGREAWPVEVKANGAVLPVIEHDNRPAVKLAAGDYRLEGAYQWNEIPQRISLPREIGILELTLEGKPVDAPVWDAEGFLWLKRDGSLEEAARDFLAVKVYAVVEDGIPLWLNTQVELVVSGKSREEDIGAILPEGWKLAAVDSPLPVIVDETGQMKAQVRAGKWTIAVDAFRIDNPAEFRYAADAKAAVTEELIAFRSRPDFRMVDIVGPPAIDVSQTTFPDLWRDLPVYRWDTATPFRIEERMRGMGLQKPEALRITREWWLDENGRELTFRDHLTGRQQQIWRLNAADGLDLGSVRSSGQGQLITRDPQTGAPGVEIRTRSINLEATGRMDRASKLSATGWRSDANGLNVTFNLPPGWRLFALFGADWVSGDWLTAWTLLDLFLLLIFSLAVFRLWGVIPALLAFFAFGLSFHEPGAPRYVWLILLLPLALLRVVPAGWGRRLTLIWKWITVGALVLILAPFLASQVQQALYPQLENVPPPVMTSEMGAMTTGDAVNVSPVSAPAFQDNLAINRKLDGIIIPRIDFQDATVREAVAFIQARAIALDDLDSDPSRKGINVIVRVSGPEADSRLTLSLTDIPLRAALDYVAKAANLKLKIESGRVVIVPQSEATDALVTKEYAVPPGFLSVGDSSVAKGSVGRSSAAGYLEAQGVTFPPGANASFQPSRGVLVVRNTVANLDLIDSMTDAAMAVPAGSGYSANLAYDAKARIQTGPGIPHWTWRTVTFGWNGPVTAAQQVRPLLISQSLERLLSAVRIALLLALAAVLLNARRAPGSFFRAAGKAAILATIGLATISSTRAEIPSEEMLETLRKRLFEASDAYPHAADIPSVILTLNGRRLSLDAEIHAAVRTAVPLPGRLPAWSPISVLVDGKPEAALRRNDGYLWVVLPAGVHRVQAEGLLADADEWEWTFELKPRRVTINAPDWTVSGVRPDGTSDQQVFFVLKQKSAESEAGYDRQNFQAVAIVERDLELGLVWQVRTRVKRLPLTGKALVLRIPLLPGENIVSSNTVVKDGFVEVRLGAQENSFIWESELSVTDKIALTTKASNSWVERWQLLVSPVWNVGISGLAPIFETVNPELMPVWHPWPGESVELAVSRPEALAGATVTVDNVTREIALGLRQRVSRLDLSLRCSLGQDFLVDLPANAEVTSLSRNGEAMPVRKDGNKLIIPLQPGEQAISLGWQSNVPLEFRAATEDVSLPVESANIDTTMTVPDNRWVLWTDGPLRGPAVRFWSILVCSLLAAWVLGLMAFSPLRIIEWMLLALGLTQVPLPAALIVIGWLFFLAWRGRDSFLRLPNIGYNLLQVLLIILTAMALSIFVAVVGAGLLGMPEMFILGNGSTATALRWYQPRSEILLPRAGCFSVSTWWYRILMLLWALWLAASLIRWLRWAWLQFSSGGCFRRKAPKPPVLPTQS